MRLPPQEPATMARKTLVIVTVFVLAGVVAAAEFFTATPTSMEARLGQTVVLKCSTTEKLESAFWTLDGFGLGDTREMGEWARYRMIGRDRDRDWNLEIVNVSLEDDAEYECQARTFRTKPARLVVLVPPRDPFIEGGAVMEVVENTNVSITCVSEEGRPEPSITWFDQDGNLISSASKSSVRMATNNKLFRTTSTIFLTPTKHLHNSTFTCEVYHRADDRRRTAVVRLLVKYSPSVTVAAVRPGMPREGEKVVYSCSAAANPPAGHYSWSLDDREMRGQFGTQLELYNVTRNLHNMRLTCEAKNVLGKASGFKTIQVQYGPHIVMGPVTAAADASETVTLYCAVDSNPPAAYFWTKGAGREPVSHEQNLTLVVSEASVGEYFCHASVSGFPVVTIPRPGEVLMNGLPRMVSASEQFGEVGTDVHINCACEAVPKPTGITWKFHESLLNESNPHYRIIETPMENGLRSTLIVRQSLATDFGTYTCLASNAKGEAHIRIAVQEQRPFPLVVALASAFVCVVLVLCLVVLVVLCRRRLVAREKAASKVGATSIDRRVKPNNYECQSTLLARKDLDPLPHPGGDAWNGGDVGTEEATEDDEEEDGFFKNGKINNNAVAVRLLQRQMEPDFPPKPDVIDTGYVPYGAYVRDFNPPFPGPDSSGYVTHKSLLNVSDPRYSAAYGNPYLRQTGPSSVLYSSVNPFNNGTSTFRPFPGSASTNRNGSLRGSVNISPPQSSSTGHNGLQSSSPHSSVSNLVCLPEECSSSSASPVSALPPLPSVLSVSGIRALSATPPGPGGRPVGGAPPHHQYFEPPAHNGHSGHSGPAKSNFATNV